MFTGRRLVVATNHKKEKVIAPILEEQLGVQCIIIPDFNTDQFGTFSGEINRTDNPTKTARKKCDLAIELSGCDLAVANEGSFGPHPSIYFIPADDELVVFYDKKNNIEIIVKELSTETNFSSAEINTWDELQKFAEKISFPSHGLILKNSETDFCEIKKGIVGWSDLKIQFSYFQNKYGKAVAQTDMRAMFNPSRMKIIEKATRKLVEKIKSICPKCSTPGFGITDTKSGLKCNWCGMPTKGIISHIYQCVKCKFTQEINFPLGKFKENPMFCDFCNP